LVQWFLVWFQAFHDRFNEFQVQFSGVLSGLECFEIVLVHFQTGSEFFLPVQTIFWPVLWSNDQVSCSGGY